MNTQTPTPRTDAAVIKCYSVLHEKVAHWELCQALERELAEKDARIAELESQRENWRMSSVCREKDAQIVALRKALGGIKVYMQSDWRKRPCDGEAQVINLIDKTLSTPPPPVVSLEDVKPLVAALQWYSDGWNGGNAKALNVLEEFTTQPPHRITP